MMIVKFTTSENCYDISMLISHKSILISERSGDEEETLNRKLSFEYSLERGVGDYLGLM